MPSSSDPLDALASLMRGRGALTAREIGEALGVTLPTVYARLARLQKTGATLTLGERREGARGPAATTFSVAR